jgi:GT2 family glycosyltransferase
MSDRRNAENVAVAILNFNGATYLPNCIGSLLRIAQPEFDIYLIDNHSSDNSIKIVHDNFPSVKIIQNETNLGFGRAYDRAIRDLDYKYIVLLNNDTAVDERWLESLVAVADSDDRIAACGSKILMMKDSSVIDHAGGMLTVIGSGLDLGKFTKDIAAREAPRETGFACGCSLLIRREAYLAVGGFDPYYFMYHEDVDLCWRLRLLGFSVMYVPDSIVYHALGGGAARAWEDPRIVHLCQKNRLANMIKNLGPARLCWGTVVSCLYDSIRIGRFLLHRRWDLSRSLIRGYVDTIRNMGTLFRRRAIVQSHRTLSDREIRGHFMPVVKAALTYRQLLGGIPSGTQDSSCSR